ncbi:MAG: hypothetical protein EON84_20390 [Bradyrhizobiaceae bacterium]|nr:MAG: hypothetical protein EON84_20390 [Bradyrhizobiaceae bacterium]
MALPLSVETEQTRQLDAKLGGLALQDLLQWPPATDDDLNTIARIITEMSEIDFMLRQIVELMNHFDVEQIPEKLRRRVSSLKIGEVEDVVEASRWIFGSNANAIQSIRDDRRMRNLVGHFAVRRFPTDNALLFLTKSDEDAKRILGQMPRPGIMITAVAEAGELARRLRVVQAHRRWLNDVAQDIGDHYFTQSKPRNPRQP